MIQQTTRKVVSERFRPGRFMSNMSLIVFVGPCVKHNVILKNSAQLVIFFIEFGRLGKFGEKTGNTTKPI